MLEALGESKAASVVMAALEHVLQAGRVRTRDLGGHSSTTDVGEAILHAMDRPEAREARPQALGYVQLIPRRLDRKPRANS